MGIKTAVILAGGHGTRISEETETKPKPLIEIGGRPIIWHIMKIYYHQGITNFILCLGYKGYLIKEYFSNYFLHMSDLTIDFSEKATRYHSERAEKWKVTMVDTGLDTMTGGRIKRIAPFIGNEHFCMTYGDGVGNIDIQASIARHFDCGLHATMTVVTPPGRFGAVEIKDGKITGFHEKPQGDGGWINGGFFVLSPKVFDYINDDATLWEREPLEAMARKEQLAAYHHSGFWQPMDTLRDKRALETHWQSGSPPWRVWAQEPI